MTKLYHPTQLALFPIETSARFVTLACSECSKTFQRKKSNYDKAVREHGVRPVYCSKGCINAGRNLLGISPTIAEEYLHGATLNDIAKQYNTSESVIWKRLKKMGIPIRDPHEWLKVRGNPMQGKTHTEAARQKIREATQRQYSAPGFHQEASERRCRLMSEGKIRAASKLEDSVAQELSRRGIAFARQYAVRDTSTGKYCACVDFMLANGTIIEVNGTYWHSDPRFYPDGPVHASQIKTHEHYTRKMSKLQGMGITVIELWEKDLRHDLAGTIEQALGL